MRRLALALSAAMLSFVPACGGTPAPADAGHDDATAETDAAARACFSDPDCDDGIWCNGVESCTGGRCTRVARDCDDAIACTRDICNENVHACVSKAADEDGDGFGDVTCLDDAGTPLGGDCDDTDPTIYPGNPEICDAIDQDCDPTTLGGGDTDHDGAVPITCCNPLPGGGTSCGRDCDDTNPSISQLATEICDGIDNDCDTNVDEHVLQESWPDLDGDGYGDRSATPDIVCIVPSSRANQGGDCDDTDRLVHASGLEVCNGHDDDCDGTIDEASDDSCTRGPTTGQCVLGHCVTVACDATHYDCNDDDSDGCEASLCGGSTTCGHCGRACPSGFETCFDGLCPGVNNALQMIGFLHDVTGAPVAGATITSIDVCPVVTATTRADGSYTLGPMYSPPAMVRIEAPGYPTHVQPAHTSGDAFGPILTQALLDAWTADPDRVSSPAPDRAIFVAQGDFWGVLNNGLLGAPSFAMGSDLLGASAGGADRTVYFQAVPGRMHVGGSSADGSGCFTSCGPTLQLLLEAGHVTYIGPYSCSTVCA
ncbi:MAG: MopE-related protein [Sandaracinus sp.]